MNVNGVNMNQLLLKTFQSILLLFILINFSEEKTSQIENKLIEVNNEFGLNIFNRMSSNVANDIISPISMLSALGILYNGLSGNAKQIWRQFLRLDQNGIKDKEINIGFNSLLKSFVFDYMNQEIIDYQLNVANSVLAQTNTKIKNNFTQILKNSFQTDIEFVDFRRNGMKILKNVNDWVRIETKDRIDKLLESPPDPASQLIILNVVYFQGKWTESFPSENTKDSDFTNAFNEKQTNEIMSTFEKNFMYSFSNELESQLLEMNYAGNKFSLIVILPSKQLKLNKLKSKLNYKILSEAIQQMKETKVNVYFPKFKFEQKFNIKAILKTINPELFSNGGLTEITNQNIDVSEIVHKVVIDINEKGTEAAAVSSVGIFSRMPTKQITFRANHPFIYLIRNKVSGLILFLGQINELGISTRNEDAVLRSDGEIKETDDLELDLESEKDLLLRSSTSHSSIGPINDQTNESTIPSISVPTNPSINDSISVSLNELTNASPNVLKLNSFGIGVNDSGISARFSKANNDFGLHVFKLLSHIGNNDIISPLSLFSSFSVLYNGARGNAAIDLRELLNLHKYGITDNELNTYFKLILEEISVQNQTEYQLNLTNIVVANQRLAVKKAFKKTLDFYYLTDLVTLDVKNTTIATDIVNEWVRTETNNRISKLFQEPIESSTILMFLNTIYFRGFWSQKFPIENTKDDSFYQITQVRTNVKMMSRINIMCKHSESQILVSNLIELPFIGNNISFIAILPKLMLGLRELRSKLNYENLYPAIKSMQTKQVDVYLPKFRNNRKYRLKNVIRNGFDLSHISDRTDVELSEIIHKILFELDENGSEVSVTIGEKERVMLRNFKSDTNLEFKANHPFIYLVWDKVNELILFIGQYSKVEN